MKEMENMQELEEENRELRRALVLLMNRRLIRELREALERVNSGDYVSEDEFFRDSPRESD